MPLDQREQWLKRVLPGLLVVVAYFTFFNGGQTQLNQLKEQHKAMNTVEFSLEAVKSHERKTAQIKQEIQQLAQQDKLRRQQFLALVQPALADNQLIRDVALAFESAGVKILANQRQQQFQLKTLPYQLQMLLKQLASTTELAQLPIGGWSLIVEGTYQQVFDALKAISELDNRIIPLSIDMRKVDNNERLQWSMTIWG